ncbi:MAG: peptidoglycan DD-metalloendopeptidase family protein [Rhodocyclaceae bacterium]|nr:peptidoglycan DD-metalloendopeptidase family protein [Rhodocyclaceae bacterium]
MIRFLAFVLLFLPGLALAAGEHEKARLESVREQRTALERQLKEAETSRAATADQLRDTEKAVSAAGRKLRVLGEERAAARAELAEHEHKLKQLERQTANRQNQLARLLRYQFRPQEADALSVLLAGGDPNAAARDRYFLALLSRAKADLIADLRQDAAETQRLTGVMRERGEKLAELAQREEGERTALRQRQQERQAVLGKISGQIKAQRREIETLKQNEQRLGNLIASLAKKSARAKPLAKAPPAQGGAPSPAPTAGAVPPAPRMAVEPTSVSGAFSRLRGKLTLPVRGVVAGRFGARRADGQSVWKGLFIRAAEGADVRAVGGGVVVFADWLRGYGNLLIIDHDDDFLSVYGNNQTLLADVGQKVGAGVTVATVGASGGQPESGLYFELRHRGQAFDPGRWLGSP